MFLRQRQLDELIEAIDHNSTVLADFIDTINHYGGKWEAINASPRVRLRGTWLPGQPLPTWTETDVEPAAQADRKWIERKYAEARANRAEAMSIVDDVHRAPDRTGENDPVDDDTPLIDKEPCP